MSDTTTVTEIARNTIRLETLSLKSLEESIGFDFEQIVQLIHESKGKVVITGVGKSGIIAMKIAASLSSTGTPAIYLHAADATHGDLGMVEKKDIVIGISKSGNSQEIKDLIPFLKNNGNTLIGMTANPESYLGKQSDYLLYTPVDKEACPHNLAPTTSTTVQLVMGDALAMSLMNLNSFQSQDFAQIHPSGSLGKKLHLKVVDLTDDYKIPRVSIGATLKEVIYEISEKRLGATVVEDNGKLSGLVTDGDIRRILEKNENISGLMASDIMTNNPISVAEDMLALDGLKLMQAKKINHLIVLGEDKNYKGMVHILDFIKQGLNG
ncbi:MAG: KpsF/GutQ family sugar-phosphate isomerase [Flavobacteriaceae bacterium]|nr:KpsF/GutQ family sugar-phosphate isomerase [Flavobacteriaceae bacterium]